MADHLPDALENVGTREAYFGGKYLALRLPK